MPVSIGKDGVWCAGIAACMMGLRQARHSITALLAAPKNVALRRRADKNRPSAVEPGWLMAGFFSHGNNNAGILRKARWAP